MDKISDTRFQQNCIQKNIPFISYSFPGKKEVITHFFDNKDVNIFYSFDEIKGQKGFVIVPFVENKTFPKLFIRFEKNPNKTTLESTLLFKKTFAKPKKIVNKAVSTPKADFLKKVEHTVAAIKSKKFKKVVLSRQLIIDVPQSRLPDIFQQMRSKLPDSFTFFVHIPEKIVWLGASPEIFLKTRQRHIETVALAGTQKIANREISKINWQDKELHEQHLVGGFIEKVLEKNAIVPYEKKIPVTSQAGNICHLKTQYSFPAAAMKDVNRLIHDLHPTPAVGGLPKDKSVSFIEHAELHKRAYYGGFLGCWNTEKDFDLFVNIRCFQFAGNKVVMYSGGGITAASIPEKEWKETCHKLEILKSLVTSAPKNS